MQIKCGIIENEKIDALQLVEAINSWGKKKLCEVNAKILPENIKMSLLDEFDLLFLDIELTEKNGIELSTELRKVGYTKSIVFVTSHNQFMIRGYHVQALDYILKPVTVEKIDFCMKKALEKKNKLYFIYEEKQQIKRLLASQILYFQSRGHNIEAYLKDGGYVKMNIPLKEMDYRKPPHFAQCCRTIYVNLIYVVSVSRKEVELETGEILPVGKTFYLDFKKQYISFLTGEN